MQVGSGPMSLFPTTMLALNLGNEPDVIRKTRTTSKTDPYTCDSKFSYAAKSCLLLKIDYIKVTRLQQWKSEIYCKQRILVGGGGSNPWALEPIS